MRKIPCYCDNIIETDFPEYIELDRHPEYYDQILDGSFQSVTCDKCGSLLKPELKVRLTDKTRKIDFFYISETDRNDFLSGKLECPAERIVIGFPELVEKIKLLNEDLNDGAMEVIKYYLKKKAGSDDITIYYDHRENNNLMLHIIGLKKDQIAVSPIPAAVYSSTLKSMKDNSESELYTAILTPPYVSCNKISVLEDEQL